MREKLFLILILIFAAANALGDETSAPVAETKNQLTPLRKAAARGDIAAQFALAWRYQDGNGVPKDPAEAVKWYRKVATRGEAPHDHFLVLNARSMLGNYYRLGVGVPEDPVEAMKWYRLAAAEGDAEAQASLGEMYADGAGAPLNDALAVKWFRKAATRGNPRAQMDLANMYFQGHGVPQDAVLAYAWANLAAVERGCAPENTRPETAAATLNKTLAELQDTIARMCAENAPILKRQNEAVKKVRDQIASALSSTQLAEAQRLSSNWKPGQVLRRESTSSMKDNGGNTP